MRWARAGDRVRLRSAWEGAQVLVGDNPPGGVAAEYAGPAPRPRAGHVVDQTAPVVGIDADGGVLVAHEPAQVIPHRHAPRSLLSVAARYGKGKDERIVSRVKYSQAAVVPRDSGEQDA